MQRLLLAFLFVFSVAATAHAGSLTIHNNNCSPWLKDHVRVHVYGGNPPGDQYPGTCTDTWVSLKHGETKTISLTGRLEYFSQADNVSYAYDCKYTHEAEGTVMGDSDIDGREDSHVTCKNDWAGVCQCKKD